MNRPFWSFRTSASPDNCETIEPLLSAYADGMASPAETRRLDAHLPGCESCRSALSWTQATRAALASRPVAVPPPDLHSRIALAIALSSRPVAVPPPDLHSRIALAIAASAAAPVLRRPARVFTVRTAYAAAASLTALGIALSYPLWHTPGAEAVKQPVKLPVLAAAPSVRTNVPLKTTRPLVASNAVKPAAVKRTIIAHKPVPTAAIQTEHIASNDVPAKLPAALQEVIAPVHHALPDRKIASRDIAPTEKQSIEKHSPLPLKTLAPKPQEGLKVAKVIKESTRVPLDIQLPKVTPDPVRQTASAHQEPSSAYDDPLGALKAQLKEKNARVRDVTLAAISVPVSHSAHDMTDLMHTLGGEEHTAVIDAIHGNQ